MIYDLSIAYMFGWFKMANVAMHHHGSQSTEVLGNVLTITGHKPHWPGTKNQKAKKHIDNLSPLLIETLFDVLPYITSALNHFTQIRAHIYYLFFPQ